MPVATPILAVTVIGEMPGLSNSNGSRKAFRTRLQISSGSVKGRDAVGYDDELIATEATQGVGLSEYLSDPCGHGLEKAVTHAMAEIVIDHLEVVQVEEEDSGLASESPVARQKLLNAVDDEGTVGEPGHGVVVGLEGHPLLMGHKLSVRVLALNLEGLGHSNKSRIQASLEHRESLRQVLFDAQPNGVPT